MGEAVDNINVQAAGDSSVRSFPNFEVGMLVGAVLAGIGLFLIGSPTSGAVTTIVGFILFLIGVIIFAL